MGNEGLTELRFKFGGKIFEGLFTLLRAESAKSPCAANSLVRKVENFPNQFDPAHILQVTSELLPAWHDLQHDLHFGLK
jgi:hypothetical protein